MVLVKRKECIFGNVRVKSTKYHIYISYKTKFPMALFLFGLESLERKVGEMLNVELPTYEEEDEEAS